MSTTPEVSKREMPLTLTGSEVRALTATVRTLFFGSAPWEERRRRIAETLEYAHKVLGAEKENPAMDPTLFNDLSDACTAAEERLSHRR